MRRSLVNIVPSEILNRRTKAYCPQIYGCVSIKLEPLQEFYIPISAQLGYLNEDNVRNTLRAVINGISARC